MPANKHPQMHTNCLSLLDQQSLVNRRMFEPTEECLRPLYRLTHCCDDNHCWGQRAMPNSRATLMTRCCAKPGRNVSLPWFGKCWQAIVAWQIVAWIRLLNCQLYSTRLSVITYLIACVNQQSQCRDRARTTCSRSSELASWLPNTCAAQVIVELLCSRCLHHYSKHTCK